MKAFRVLIAGLAIGFMLKAASPAQAGHGGWSVGVNFGVPFCYRPWYGYGGYGYYGYPYYRPYPVYVGPAPIYVQPTPVIQTVPIPQPVYQSPGDPATAPAPRQVVAQEVRQDDITRHLRSLNDSDERVRADNAMQLGRLKVVKAIDPLAATLSGDKSPLVRESAARALGLIGSPKALLPLQHAADKDQDNDVRHSAAFAIEIIQATR